MRRWLAARSFNQRLGLLAVGLGAIALFADVGPGRKVTIDAKELLTAVERREDHVTAGQLAGWIVEGRSDYRLVDLRDERSFAEYHIPGALNLPLATVADGALARDERILLYGDGGIHAAQAWMVLRGKGYRTAYTLLGGLDAWREEVLFPVPPASPTTRQLRDFERAAQLARFFGGQPRAAAGPAAGPPPALPTAASVSAVAVPTLPSGAAGALPRKKTKEGC